MKSSTRQLQKELRHTGASPAELEQLVPIASELGLLKTSRTAHTSDHVTASPWPRMVTPAAFITSGLALGMFLIVMAQAALPTSRLYAVQKFSDSIVVSFQPQYRANIMMKRAQQVNELVGRHADAKQVLTTLADYTKEASIYTSSAHTNYTALEYCKANLQEAATAATPKVRQAISSSLRALETV